MSAVLTAYNPGGTDLFADGSVEAAWYQSDGFYVVLYRGFDFGATGPLCPGNSILTDAGFVHVSNGPLGAEGDEVCVGVPNLATPPAGPQQCGALTYYVTEIPVNETGMLFGTLEINDGAGFAGHTSSVDSDIDNTPEFIPGESSYSLPASSVDDAAVVTC